MKTDIEKHTEQLYDIVMRKCKVNTRVGFCEKKCLFGKGNDNCLLKLIYHDLKSIIEKKKLGKGMNK